MVNHRKARSDLSYVGERANPLGVKGSERIDVRVSENETTKLWIMATFDSPKPNGCVDLSDVAERRLVRALIKFMNEDRDRDFVDALSYDERVACLEMAERTGCKDAICVFVSAVYELSANDMLRARRTAVRICSPTLMNAVDSAICRTFGKLNLHQQNLRWHELRTWLDTSRHDETVEDPKIDSVYYVSEEYLLHLVRKWLIENPGESKRDKHALVGLIRPRLLNDPDVLLQVHRKLFQLSSIDQLFKDATDYAKLIFRHHSMNEDGALGVRHWVPQAATFGTSTALRPQKPCVRPFVHVHNSSMIGTFYRGAVARNLAYLVCPDGRLEEGCAMRLIRYNPINGTVVRLANSEVPRSNESVSLCRMDEHVLLLSGGGPNELETYDLSSGVWKVDANVADVGVESYVAHAACRHNEDLCLWYVDGQGDHLLIVMRRASGGANGKRTNAEWKVVLRHPIALPDEHKQKSGERLSLHSFPGNDAVAAFHGNVVVTVHVPSGACNSSSVPSHPTPGDWVCETKIDDDADFVYRIGRNGIVDRATFVRSETFGVKTKVVVDRMTTLEHGVILACVPLLFSQGMVQPTSTINTFPRKAKSKRFSLLRRKSSGKD